MTLYLALLRLEYALAPAHIPVPVPAIRLMGRDKNGKSVPYWASGYVTALTEDACNRAARKSALSLANVPSSLLSIPWC